MVYLKFMNNLKEVISLNGKEKKFYKNKKKHNVIKQNLKKPIILSLEDYDNYKTQVYIIL